VRPPQSARGLVNGPGRGLTGLKSAEHDPLTAGRALAAARTKRGSIRLPKLKIGRIPAGRFHSLGWSCRARWLSCAREEKRDPEQEDPGGKDELCPLLFCCCQEQHQCGEACEVKDPEAAPEPGSSRRAAMAHAGSQAHGAHRRREDGRHSQRVHRDQCLCIVAIEGPDVDVGVRTGPNHPTKTMVWSAVSGQTRSVTGRRTQSSSRDACQRPLLRSRPPVHLICVMSTAAAGSTMDLAVV